MEPFPDQWNDNAKNRSRWAQMQLNESFLREQLASQGELVCHYCGKAPLLMNHWKEKPSPDVATVDHVTPSSLGGSNDPSNLVVACSPCNNRKGDRLV